MIVSSEQIFFITQWRGRSATEWRGQPNEPTSSTTSDANHDLCEHFISSNLDMEKFIEQLRREHGMDATHMKSCAQYQEKFESATLALLSTIFDSNLSKPILKSPPCVNSYTHPILVRSIDEINVALQHIAQPETSKQSSQPRESLKHYGHENIPKQHIDQ